MSEQPFSDKICLILDNALRALSGHTHTTSRTTPAASIPESLLSSPKRRHAAACMRINHAGEIAAQALYHGQAFVSRSDTLREQLFHAATEEGDHLSWCSQRLTELNSHISRLTPFWYAGSFVIGAMAGLAGGRWSLGFVAETESQVMKHLDKHLQVLPPEDNRSRAILQQMHHDENTHRETAIQAGAARLPSPVQMLMRFASAVMVNTAYWV
jgi:ubiquinone biosynthesis monooxygenase Coq7